METLDAGSRHRDPLPPIGLLDLDKAKKDGPDYHPRYPPMSGPRASEVSLVSPTMHSGPPPPYSYPPSATSSAPGVSGYISPPESRRTFEDEKEQHLHRQSLPSIQEALGADKPLAYATSVPTSHPPPTQTPTIANAPSSLHRPHTEAAPSGPPNPFSHSQVSTPYIRENPYAQMRSQPETQRPSAPTAPPQDPRVAPFQALNGPKSPPQHPRAGSQSYSGAPYAPPYDYQPKSASTTSPNGYNNPTFQNPFAYSSQPPPNSATYPPAHYDNRPYPGGWEAGGQEAMRPDKRVIPRAGGPGPPHNESIKRQLDVFDIEAALNEIADGSNRTYEFARVYAARSHQTDRTGPVPGSLPSVLELDDMIRNSNRVTDSLARIKGLVISQQHALAEQRAQNQSFEGMYDEEGNPYAEDYKGGGAFAGGDAKKRRGKAAPPGRCHSCNRAETPEWRRGPDGARTLCNACGLHYAKLTRKQGANKANLAGSNLRPKNMEP